MPPPKSPSTPSHPRRPGASRRSSSEKSTKSSKHAVTSGESSSTKGQPSMSDSPSGARAPHKSDTPDHDKTKREDASRYETARSKSPITNISSNAEVRKNSTEGEEGRELEKRSSENRSGISNSTSAAEVERLRAAMNAQIQLNQHREKLARHLIGQEERGIASPVTAAGKNRVSPIHEERASPSLDEIFASPIPTGMETTSTESARTVRGGTTPGHMAVRTPSYPFPPMRTPGTSGFSGHRPFTALSPTINPANYAGGHFDSGIRDQVLSGSVTPASTLKFQPSGTYDQQDDPNFTAPNLYELSLMLASEPGLDPWWATVAQIMRDLYHAHRVTLSIPADPTDLENVPWGQKATFNMTTEDKLSLNYIAGGSSIYPSSGDTNETSNSENTNAGEDLISIASPLLSVQRPGLLSRHSFTTYEDTKRDFVATIEAGSVAAGRPAPLVRAKSYLSARPDMPAKTAIHQNPQLNLQSLQSHMEFEAAKEPQPTTWENAPGTSREVRAQLFSVLQALDYEAEPLIDSKGVLKVLERGKVIALTRDYPYNESTSDEKSGGSKSSQPSNKSRGSPSDKGKKNKLSETRMSSFFGSRPKRSSRSARVATSDKGKSALSSGRSLEGDDEAQPPSPKYQEYEQAPPSPWSQSPAPSPAGRVETAENPFFADINTPEDTFNPQRSPQDYTEIPQPETIGADRLWTVLHIPLFHPLLSKPVQSFRLDSAAMESKSAARGKSPAKDDDDAKGKSKEESKPNHTPIAILSILTPIIPYPSILRNSLNHLAPHLATSFSLCMHYSNLEIQVAGLARKRPQTTGFGAVAPGARTSQGAMNMGQSLYSPVDENGPQQSTAGSMTSPSDYSAVSRSTAGSPSGTPGWDPGSVGMSLDMRSSGGSPNYNAGESYFSSRARPGLGRVNTGSASSIVGARRTSKETSPAETRQKLSRSAEEPAPNSEPFGNDTTEEFSKDKIDHEDRTITPKQEPRMQRRSRESGLDINETRDISPPRQSFDSSISPRRLAMRTASNQGQAKQHTQLHSYGADFGATFQSLPTTSAVPIKPPGTQSSNARSGSISVPAADYMPPPSDRVKGVMLDSLPVHLFIALPPTGEIVWVNSRYLTYRGQSVKDLHDDPWSSIHPEDREEYLKSWSHAIRTGEQLTSQVRLKRFDGTYRWFYTRAIALKDTKGVIVQWYGTHMDIHDQHVAEVKAARQEEIEASEAKHRQLANLIPQIIFSATEEDGVTFANQQWLSYTGQPFEDSLGIGFMDYVHPDDLAKCNIPINFPPTHSQPGPKKPPEPSRNSSQTSSGVSSGVSSGGKSSNKSGVSETPTETTIKGMYQSLSRTNSSSSSSVYEFPTSDLAELMRNGVIKVGTDSNGRISYSTEVRLRSKTGEYRWHLVRCVEIDNINLGTGDGSWFGACADINDHKLLEMKLKEAMDSKSKFLSNMSHEIRTPLIGISGMVSFLQDTPLNDEQLDYCNTISSSAQGLLNIINDILDLAKADAGMMKLSHDWFHTRSLVEEVNEMVSTLAITKHLEVNYVVDIEVPEMIKGDRFRIRQILLNVIGNAIKFTDTGEVFSRCKVLKEETAYAAKNEVVLEFSIIDTGRGFTQEEAEVIFRPFSQIDSSSTRTHGGTGLGLVISRQLVELHGGKMEGTAVPGRGSTFTFSATFGLPTEEDHPEVPTTPAVSKTFSAGSSIKSATSTEASVWATKRPAAPVLGNKLFQSPAAESPRTESTSNTDSPSVVSSGSSEPSIHSLRSLATQRSSATSIAHSLALFNEAAEVTRSDAANMILALPDKHSSPDSAKTPTPTGLLSPRNKELSRSASVSISPEAKQFRPPMYSILILCPQALSREATTQHIEMTLPKDVPHQITALEKTEEAKEMIGGDNPVIFTHVVINLGSKVEIVTLIDQIVAIPSLSQTVIVILSDPLLRQDIMTGSETNDYNQLFKDGRLTFIFKPVKPSRFAVIFDPDKERDLSTDRNRFSAQQQVATQRQNYLDIGKRLGNKGLKVLLVEDNATNQKVLLKFLSKVGIGVELAMDGVECTDKVFSHPYSFYSLILCDLHMPNKDGYQACREIREWEKEKTYPRMPIIALSANVMADVLDKCIDAGFSSYITKPVDFKALSKVMGDLLDPSEKESAVVAGSSLAEKA